ncbi:hypothetical protein LCGC14_0542440 [marine sediment metagenome]|uniref:Uncharacterized protein n=1 Tax=marine sediment metagenome TaxID=412755 RepID=A0A0F9RX58_9ZZZZ
MNAEETVGVKVKTVFSSIDQISTDTSPQRKAGEIVLSKAIPSVIPNDPTSTHHELRAEEDRQ